MDISLINTRSLLHLLSLAEKKEELLQILGQIDAEIIRTLQGGVLVEVVEITSAPAIARPAPAAKKPDAVAPVPTVKIPKAKKKRTMSAAGRARISAATTARWAALRGDKAAEVVVTPKPVEPAKPTKRKSGLTPEGRAKLAANVKARWAAKKIGKPARKAGPSAKKTFKLPKKA